MVFYVQKQPRKKPNKQNNEEEHTMKKRMHLAKIDMADEIFVINVGGYIGDRTRSEIKYAEANGKPVRYLES